MQRMSSFRNVSAGVHSDAEDHGDVCPLDGNNTAVGVK